MIDHATEWAWRQRGDDGEPLAPNVRLALLAFAREADDCFSFTLKRKDLAERLQCSVDTVDRRVKTLVAAKLLRVEKTLKKGGYRASRYFLELDAASRKAAATVVNIADMIDRETAASPSRNVAASNNQEDRSPAASQGRKRAATLAATGAASIKESLPEIEVYPERVEPTSTPAVIHVLNGTAKTLPAHKLGEIIFAHVDSPRLDKRSRAFNQSCEQITKWMGAGLDFDADILPTVKAICADEGDRIGSWNYFNKPMAKCLRERTAPQKPFDPNEYANDQSSSASAPTVRREKISAATAQRERDRIRLEAEARDRAINLGRMESVRIE